MLGIMKRVLIIAVFSICAFGCRQSNSMSPEDRRVLDRQTILDEALTNSYSKAEYDQAERDLPTDTWQTNRKEGRYNQSRLDRDMKLVQMSLDNLKPRLKHMSAHQLLSNLKVLPPLSSSLYGPIVVVYTYDNGNQMIIEELEQRSRAELEALRSQTNDDNKVAFDGDGPDLTVGNLVKRLIGQ
jgi:hypothetical protein